MKTTSEETGPDEPIAVRQAFRYSWGELFIHSALADLPETANEREERLDRELRRPTAGQN